MSSIMGLPADDLLKPPGFDAPITPIDGCCAVRCKAFLDGSYRRGCKDTVDRMLEIIVLLEGGAKTSFQGKYLYGNLGALEVVRREVLALKEGEPE